MVKSKLNYKIDKELLLKAKYITKEKEINLNTLLSSYVDKLINSYEELNGVITEEQMNSFK